VGNDQSLEVVNNRTVTVKGRQQTGVTLGSSHSAKEITIKAADSYEVQSQGWIAIGCANDRTDFVGGAYELYTKTTKIEAEGTFDVTAGEINLTDKSVLRLTCGASSIVMTTGMILINSPLIALNP
jgi:hypothetical protein